jgi:hypothetical protein
VQDRYVGDVGDFAKYALLRSITRKGGLRLGVNWCLFCNESHNSDGRHTSYLQKPEFRSLDPELHDGLATIVNSGDRSLRRISGANFFPAETIFFDSPVMPIRQVEAGRSGRRAHRAKWISSALAATVKCDVVFFDPDNGFETPSVPIQNSKAGKYIFLEELTSFWGRGQSLIVYHHLNRRASVKEQTRVLQKRLGASFRNAAFVKCLLFRRGSCRHFWILGQARHAAKLKLGIETIIRSGWSGYFEVS